MDTDPVVAEVRAVREQLAARLGFRLHDIVKEAQRQDAAGDRKVVRLPPRRPIAAAVARSSQNQRWIRRRLASSGVAESVARR